MIGVSVRPSFLPSVTQGLHLLSVTPTIPLNGIICNFHRIFIIYSHYAPPILDFDKIIMAVERCVLSNGEVGREVSSLEFF